MRDPISRPNSVGALRSRNRPRQSMLRKSILRAVILVTIAAIVVSALTNDRQMRGWGAAVAVLGVVIAAVAWLAGASLSLSKSGRDPQNFENTPGDP